MPPTKTHRSSSSGALRAHSRSSSASRLGANLQLTTKEFTGQKPVDKAKKSGHDAHTRLPRTHSASRIDSRDPHATKRAVAAPPPPLHTKTNGSKLKGGFTINFEEEEEGDDDDDDAWVSSESGVEASNRYSDSDTDSDSMTTTSATPIARDSSMRAPYTNKRSSSGGSTKRPHVVRNDTVKVGDAKRAAVPEQKSAPAIRPQQRLPEPDTKGPPSPISPISQPPTHSTPTQKPNPRTSPSQVTRLSGASNTAALTSLSQPPHLTPEQGDVLRKQAQSKEMERRRAEYEGVDVDFNLTHKINGSPFNNRLPAPGQFLESQSRGGSRPAPQRAYADWKNMEPTAAARFAEAIAAQDQDPRIIAAALSKPSSPNVREHRMQPRKPAPLEVTTAEVPDPEPVDQRRHSSVTGSEPAKREGSVSPKSKRHSRPSSVYSVSSKHLRPHPLIRGQSHGPGAPLQPLAVVADAAEVQLASSTSSDDVPPSPSSVSTAPSSPVPPTRRSSVSSTRSVATLPAHPVTTRETHRSDRSRTLSTISSSSTIAALSSLVNHPIVPSQRITFFPRVDEDEIRKIHPLPPVALTSSHLHYITHRSPIRESYDRLMRAKAGR